jgi:nucleotide-binding universal stress UspA family protein
MTAVAASPTVDVEDVHDGARPLPLDGPVVVAVDGSGRTRDSVALAARLAVPGQQLVLAYVHPYRRLGDPMAGGAGGQLVRAIAETTLAALPDTLGPGPPPDMRLVSADCAAEGVHRIARDTGAALIVVASSRRAGLARVLEGSVAESIMAGAPVPVAFAPPDYAAIDAALATIGSAFDGSRATARPTSPS